MTPHCFESSLHHTNRPTGPLPPAPGDDTEGSTRRPKRKKKGDTETTTMRQRSKRRTAEDEDYLPEWRG
jgi:hypothetical protein